MKNMIDKKKKREREREGERGEIVFDFLGKYF